ncbi:MAG: hemolysin family protein [Spongiibacteraceae bacterium]
MAVGSNLLLVALALLLVVLNGFFVAAEFGLVKLRQTRVRALAKNFGFRGRVLARVHGSLDAYLSACQLGITLTSLGLGWVGEPAFSRLLEPLFAAAGIDDPRVVHGASFLIAFATLSYLHIVVGELAPKSMALRKPEGVSLWTAAPLYGFYWLMYPAIWVLNHSSNQILRWVGLDVDHNHDAHYSVEELKLILRTSRADKRFTGDEWRVLAQALDFRDLEVADLLRPFNEAQVLQNDLPLDDNLDRIAQHRFSRYPLIDSGGAVMGIVHLKDIFIALRKAEAIRLEELARPALMVLPSLPAMELFRRFQQGAPHFAIVAHEDGRPLGFVTLDNLLGAWVGEIRDEFKRSSNEWTKLDDGSLMGKGSLPIFTLERALGLDIPSEQADTVGGLVLWKLGELPKEGQRIQFEHFDIVVKKMTGPRILLVRVYPRHADALDWNADG